MNPFIFPSDPQRWSNLILSLLISGHVGSVQIRIHPCLTRLSFLIFFKFYFNALFLLFSWKKVFTKAFLEESWWELFCFCINYSSNQIDWIIYTHVWLYLCLLTRFWSRVTPFWLFCSSPFHSHPQHLQADGFKTELVSLKNCPCGVLGKKRPVKPITPRIENPE